MKALVWCAPLKVNVEQVPDPTILNPRDAIVRVTSTCICGSDLHLVDGFIPFMKPGDILGHEAMGIVEEVGPGVNSLSLKVGDRVIVPFPIGCGSCFFCKRDMWSCCENSNPQPHIGETMYGHSTAGIFGYSHLTGGYAGGQAEYVSSDDQCVSVRLNLARRRWDSARRGSRVMFLSIPRGYDPEEGKRRPFFRPHNRQE